MMQQDAIVLQSAQIPVAPRGPIYCDTAHMFYGIHEPVNTLTNVFILIAAYLAYRYVRKSRVGFTADLVVLIFLLAMTGIGSTLWHGLRTMWALQLDWMPGVAFLLVFAGLWMGKLFGRVVGWLGPLAMIAAAAGSVMFGWNQLGSMGATNASLRFIPAFATITAVGLILVGATARRYGMGAASQGALILLFGVTAAVFRSIDLMMCELIPFGTHFLWHLCLSTASFLGIVLLVKMKLADRRAANSE